MKLTPKEYSAMADKASPGSKSVQNILMAFLFGGLISTIGQILVNLYMQAGLSLKDARAVVSVTLVGLGALLTALRIYDNIAKHAGAGTLVPITGFANSIVAPAIEFKIAGPVLVFGITASIIYGFILWIFQLF